MLILGIWDLILTLDSGLSLSTKLFRFVNAVTDSKLDKKVIWSFIEVLRLEYLKKNGNIKCEASHEKDSFID